MCRFFVLEETNSIVSQMKIGDTCDRKLWAMCMIWQWPLMDMGEGSLVTKFQGKGDGQQYKDIM